MGVALALGASLVWGVADFLGGSVARRLRTLVVVLASQSLSAVLMLLFAAVTGSWGAPRDYLPWGVAAAVFGLTALWLFYGALAAGTMGIVSPIAALGVLVPLGVGLVRGQVPSGPQVLGIVLALVGVVLASGPEVSGRAGLRPVLMAAGAALGFGTTYALIAEGSKTSVVMTMTTMRCVSLAVAVVALLIARNVGGVTRRDLLPLALVGTFDVLGNVLYGLASQAELLAVVAVLGNLFPVVTVILAWRLLHERLLPVQYVGIVVVLAGVSVITALSA